MGLVTGTLPDVEWAPLKPYWEALRQHELAFPKCSACGRFQWYPRSICPACMSRDFTWTTVAPRGHIYSHTTVRRVWMPDAKVPYSTVQVAIDEAPGVILICNLADEAQAEKLAIRLPLKIEFVEVDAGKGSNRPAVVMPFARILDKP